jgi:DNA-binding NtrC family response regulator
MDRARWEQRRLKWLSRLPTLRQLERRHIFRMLDLCEGNRHDAAERLGISTATLYRRLNQFKAG